MTGAKIEYRESPFPPPIEIREYADIDPQFARDIFDMVKANQQAQIDARLVPIHAEASALKAATIAVAFFPWLAIIGAVFLAAKGYDTAATISAIVGVASAGPQIIAATRRARGPQQK